MAHVVLHGVTCEKVVGHEDGEEEEKARDRRERDRPLLEGSETGRRHETDGAMFQSRMYREERDGDQAHVHEPHRAHRPGEADAREEASGHDPVKRQMSMSLFNKTAVFLFRDLHTYVPTRPPADEPEETNPSASARRE